MKNLVQRLVGNVIALGLAGCVSHSHHDPVASSESPIYAPILEVSGTADYNTVNWEMAYFTAISDASDDDKIFLSDLRFESYLEGKDRVRVVRVLSNDEVNSLEIKTRQELGTYLKQKSQHYRGYIGPNLLF